MVGPQYWSTGIQLKYHGEGKWSARAEFFDDGFVDHRSSEGELRARYIGAIENVIDVVRADVERLGIRFNRNQNDKPVLMAWRENDDEYPMPKDWKLILFSQASRIGWDSVYGQPTKED